jgi:hypothetical protein
MPAGQILQVLVCAETDPGSGNGQVYGPVLEAACPRGQNAYLVSSYVPFASSQPIFEGLALPFDAAAGGGIFGFGFGIVVFFWLLGLKGSVLLRPFWGK